MVGDFPTYPNDGNKQRGHQVDLHEISIKSTIIVERSNGTNNNGFIAEILSRRFAEAIGGLELLQQ